ncbi:MAG TPA: BamA/TamA family outer membrane protein [bacterium]|nr:BamA/TamA family outer membrane protein [bacterium]
MAVKTRSVLGVCTLLTVIFAHVPAAFSAWSRTADPVVIEGAQLDSLLGKAPSSIRAFAWSGGWQAIPFQIDERMETSGYKSPLTREYFLSYAFDRGPESGPDPDPSFDPDDELVFMAMDAGPKTGDGMGPAGGEACEEIKLVDPGSGDASYVYVCAMASPPPLSPRSYVSLVNDDTIEASGYVAAYPAGNPVNFERFQVKGADGLLPNVVDRMKLQMVVEVIFGAASYPLTEQDFNHYLRGVRAGPVRVVKEFETVLETWASYQKRAYNHVYFYPRHIEYDLRVESAANWGEYINKSSLILAIDLNDDARGMKFVSQHNPEGFMVDGYTDPSELHLDYGPTEWAAVSGNRAGTIMVHLGLAPRTALYQDLYYADNDDKSDPVETTPGMIGKFGYIVRELQKAGHAPFPVRFAVYGDPRDYRPGMEAELTGIYQDPLTVETARHELKSVWPDAEPVADTRKEKPQSTFMEQKRTVQINKFLSPAFIIDPYLLGVGPGLSYSDIDFLGGGTSFGFLFLFTDRGYYSYSVDFSNLRFIKGVESFRVSLDYGSFPAEPYRGIGNDSELSHLTYYWWKKSQANVTFSKYFGGIYGADFRVGYNQISITSGIQPASGGEGVPSIEERYGRRSELTGARWGGTVYGMQGGNLNSFSVTLYRDMREARNLPKFGNYESLDLYVVSGIFGASYDYARATVDLRGCWHPDFLNPIPYVDSLAGPRRTLLTKLIGPDKNRTLAARLQMSHLFANEIDWYGRRILDVPFYELTTIGSSSSIKGFASRRFRDNDMVTASLEYRWRLWKFQDAALFYDVGMVADDLFERDTWDQPWHGGYGFSYRIHVPPNIIITAEWAWSDEESGLFYQMNYGF